MNFSIKSPGQSIAAIVASSTRVQLPVFDEDVLFYNPGPNPVYVRSGDATVVATTACLPILSGEKGAYSKGSDSHVAVISTGGAQTVYVFTGTGS